MTCASAPERFTLLADTRERDMGRAAQYCLDCALPIQFCFYVLVVRHMMIHKRIPSSMNKYNFTAITYHVDAHKLLRITQHKMSQKTFHCSSIRSITHSSESQCAAYRGRCRMSSILQATQ